MGSDFKYKWKSLEHFNLHFIFKRSPWMLCADWLVERDDREVAWRRTFGDSYGRQGGDVCGPDEGSIGGIEEN